MNFKTGDELALLAVSLLEQEEIKGE